MSLGRFQTSIRGVVATLTYLLLAVLGVDAHANPELLLELGSRGDSDQVEWDDGGDAATVAAAWSQWIYSIIKIGLGLD